MLQSPNLPARPGPLVGGANPLEVRSRRPLSRWRRVARRVAPPVLGLGLRVLGGLCRHRSEGEAAVAQRLAAGPVIFTLWHDQLVLGWWALRQIAQQAPLAWAVSPSKDGELAVDLLTRAGDVVVRGSATRSGVTVLHGLYRAMRRQGASPVILPDGPRGPRRRCKAGPLLLARTAAAAVVPVRCSASRGWQLGSWDRMEVPAPGARLVVSFGAPLEVPGDADEHALEQLRLQLEQQLGAAVG
jgi:lysophospholipid acyltransferase (LPLAT)-like uncharacterized protein